MGKPRTRWENIVLSDTSQIPRIREWRRRAEDREKWRRILKETRFKKIL
jgi:hypothetical protein